MKYYTILRIKIYFYDIKTKENKFGHDISVSFEEIGRNNEKNCLLFEINKKIDFSFNLLAIALSTLCGRHNYQEIYFDFPVCSDICKKIEDFTLSVIKSKKDNRLNSFRKGFHKNSIVLNFSGGFDSLAALFLMPENTKLCSMDFGGRFSREKKFYEKFDPFIVSTNIIDTKLRSNSWSFMGIASILSSQFYNTKYYSFGSILEASPDNLSSNPRAAEDMGFPPFLACGMKNVPYVLGLTEIATAIIVNKIRPDLLEDSLESLASEGETKSVRKKIILDLICKKDVIFPSKPIFNFGDLFADDFLFFYFAKFLESDIHKIYSNVPDIDYSRIKNLKLNFFEKINPIFYKNMPLDLKKNFYMKTSDIGLEFYLENDWKELREVSSIMSLLRN